MFGAKHGDVSAFFVLLLFVPESPRWLLKAGHEARGLDILTRVSGTPNGSA